MAEHNKFYKKPYYYDVVFDRNVSREVDFVLNVYKKHAGKQAKSALDLACGPGYHALETARRGLTTYGLDLNEEMLDLAKEKAAAENLSVTWLAKDMRDFKLKSPVDVAFIMFDGIDALLTNKDIVAHFKTIAKNLTRKGIYIIDLTHPRDCSLWDYGKFSYKGRKDGVAVNIEWATNKPKFDLITNVAEVEMTMKIKDHGKDLVIKDTASERLLLPQEISLLADLSGTLKAVDWYGDFDIKQPFDNKPASHRMITILQKS